MLAKVWGNSSRILSPDDSLVGHNIILNYWVLHVDLNIFYSEEMDWAWH